MHIYKLNSGDTIPLTLDNYSASLPLDHDTVFGALKEPTKILWHYLFNPRQLFWQSRPNIPSVTTQHS